MNLISQVIPFSELLNRLNTIPEHAWIYMREEVSGFTLDTEANLYTIDSHELTDEEADSNEAALSEAGLEVALSKQQLEDVISNAQQRGVKNPSDLMRFIDYYVFHDAFLPE
jgi:hypothetical protein